MAWGGEASILPGEDDLEVPNICIQMLGRGDRGEGERVLEGKNDCPVEKCPVSAGKEVCTFSGKRES